MDIGRLNVKLMADAKQFTAGLTTVEKGLLKTRTAYHEFLKGLPPAERAAWKDMEAARKEADQARKAAMRERWRDEQKELKAAAKERASVEQKAMEESAKRWKEWRQWAWDGMASGASAFASAFASGVTDAFQSLQADAIQARQLGLSVLDLRAAMHWAGPAAKEMAAALGHLSGHFVGLQTGSESAARDLRGLAAASGVSVGALRAGGKPGIFDAIAAVRDPSIRAAQAFLFLKDSAGALIDQFSRGGMANSRDMMRRLGLGASEAELAAIQAVMRAWQDIQAVSAGFYNQVALGIAPVVARIADGFRDWKIDLTGVKAMVDAAVTGAAKLLGLIQPTANDIKKIGLAWDVVWRYARSGWLEFQSLMTRGIAQVFDAMQGSWGARDITADQKKFLAARGLSAKTREGAELEIGALQARMGAKEERILARQALQKLQHLYDATLPPPGPAAGVDLPLIKALTDAFNGMRTGLAVPAEKFSEAARQLAMMGRFGIGDQFTRNRMAFKAGQDLLSAAGMSGPTRFPQAMEAYSREAYNALAVFQDEGRRGGPADEIKAALEALKQQAALEAQIGEQMLRQLEKIAGRAGALVDLAKDDGKA